MKPESVTDVLIIGAGAAGLLCAIEAGKRGRRVCVLDHAERIGKKILISGGGRCNFTNREVNAGHFRSSNPHFVKSALARFTPADFIARVEAHGIAYREKKLGQLFCETSSKAIVHLLQADCAAAGVVLTLQTTVERVEKVNGRFRVTTSGGTMTAENLVIASGGLSFPQLGATALGYRIAEHFGLAIIPPRPALVPLTWGADDLALFGPLSGLSIAVAVSCRGKTFREALLFTHRGLSGPAILQISSYWQAGESLAIDLLPTHSASTILLAQKSTHPRRELATVLSHLLPQRFVETWCARHAPSRPLQEYTDIALREIATRLHHWCVTPAGTEGYRKAEVTGGGVDTQALSSQTMEVRTVPGLYFIGEVLDVTGELGGFNFQWAWASGYVAGQAV